MVTLTATDAELIACELAKRQFVTDDGYDFLSCAYVVGQRFERWPHLIRLAHEWQAGESQIVLKARQVGISWLLAAYAVWRMVRGDSVLIVSRGQREAIELMDKARHVYYHLPPGLAGHLRTANEMELQHAGGGRILALPSTQDAGRGYTVDLVIADEAAFHPWAAQNYAAYLPTISAGGQLLMVSTASGSMGFFAELYHAAVAGQTDYQPRFVAWHDRPGRDAAWLHRQRERFVGLPAEFAQEFPGTAAEAFVTLTGLVYPMFSRERHLRYNPCKWREYRDRYGAIDLGGGDPQAVMSAGLHYDGSLQFHHLAYWPGGSGMTVDDAINAAWQMHEDAAFTRVVIDPPIKSIVDHFRAMGLPAYPREGKKQDGLAEVAAMLETGKMFYDPSMEQVCREYESYRWRERVDPHSKDRYRTSTPIDHHGETMDCTRMIVLAALADRVIYQRQPLPVRMEWS